MAEINKTEYQKASRDTGKDPLEIILQSGLGMESVEDGVKIFRTGEKSYYKIILDKEVSLWYIEPHVGILPKSLRGYFTSPTAASSQLKNFCDEHKAREMEFTRKKKSLYDKQQKVIDETKS